MLKIISILITVSIALSGCASLDGKKYRYKERERKQKQEKSTIRLKNPFTDNIDIEDILGR